MHQGWGEGEEGGTSCGEQTNRRKQLYDKMSKAELGLFAEFFEQKC